MRAVAIQAAAALLVALAFLAATGPRQGLAAAVGGIAMLAGNGLAAGMLAYLLALNLRRSK